MTQAPAPDSSNIAAGDLLAALRRGCAEDTADVEAQILYERWLKREHWQPRNEALPLVAGIDPADWTDYLATHDLAAVEAQLWQAFVADNPTAAAGDTIAVQQVVNWFTGQGCRLPLAFARLFEFVQATMLESSAQASAGTEAATVTAEEREIVLGAALSLVAKVPERCRDANGFIDGQAIAALIDQTAARWFPVTAPQMDAAAMAALIDHYLE